MASRRQRGPAGRTRGARGKQADRRAITPAQRGAFIDGHRMALLSGLSLLVLLAAAVILGLKLTQGNKRITAATAAPEQTAAAAVVASVPAAVYDQIGLGSASNAPKSVSNGQPLTADGKPEVLYVGAEYCPFCAAERWALIAALSRFGAFSNVHTTRSTSHDVYPDTPTFTFYGAGYNSRYLTLTAVEQFTNQRSGNGYVPLQSLSSEQNAIINQYDRPPYTSAAGGIPFIDFGGRYVLSGATYNPAVLAGKDWTTIAAQLSQPSTPQARGILGSANLISAALCQLTAGQPQGVCRSAGVLKAAAALK